MSTWIETWETFAFPKLDCCLPKEILELQVLGVNVMLNNETVGANVFFLMFFFVVAP